jgi:hypothetical protein
VSADLSDFFAAAGADADRGALAPPDVLRRRGDARNRRSFIAVTSVVVVVVAILAGAGIALASRPMSLQHEPGTGPGPMSPTAVPTTEQPAPPPTTPNAPPTTAPPANHGGACTAADLTFGSMTTGFAMGTAGQTFTLHASVACTLSGFPVLTYRSDGAQVALPTEPDGDPATITVPAGGTASFTLLHTNGLGGYPPNDPNCATLHTFGGLRLVLPDHSTLPLGTSSFQVQCGGIRAQSWQLAS